MTKNENMDNKTENKRIYSGLVVSDKMDKTIVVKLVRSYKHALLKKVVKSSKNYKVHDAAKIAKIGDEVEFFEGKKLSKSKYMYLHRVVRGN